MDGYKVKTFGSSKVQQELYNFSYKNTEQKFLPDSFSKHFDKESLAKTCDQLHHYRCHSAQFVEQSSNHCVDLESKRNGEKKKRTKSAVLAVFYKQANTAEIVDMFRIEMISTESCDSCKDVELSLQNVWSLLLQKTKRNYLPDSFEKQFVKERLERKCRMCSVKSIDSQLGVSNFPQVFVLTLNHNGMAEGKHVKDETFISCPLRLQSQSALSVRRVSMGKVSYLGEVVINHSGSLGSGHYTGKSNLTKQV
jgi:Ubiquitin carboxyl-terminal hydrolase